LFIALEQVLHYDFVKTICIAFNKNIKHKVMKKFIFLSAVLAIVLTGCSKFDEVGSNETTSTNPIVSTTNQGTKIVSMSDLSISENFDWRTIKTLEVQLELPATGDLKQTRIYSPDGEKLFFKGYPEDGSRVLRTLVTVPTYINSVLVKYGDGTEVPITEVPVSEVNMSLNMASLKGGGGGGNECDNCDGKVTKLTLRYIGSIENAFIEVFQKKDKDNNSFSIFEDNRDPNDTLSFKGVDKNLTLGTKIQVHIGGEHHVEIHTSCSQDIYVGLQFGDFEVVAGASKNGGDFPDCGNGNGDDDDDDSFIGTFAVEDLWPGKGDYDINDLVVEYNFDVTKDNQENVEHITATFTIRAFGAGLHNGFGFEFPGVAPEDIVSVSGYDIVNTSSYSLASNGVENGQSSAVFIAYDDAYRMMQHPGSGIGVNTDKPAPYVTPVTITLEIEFVTDAVTYSELNIGEFNPFIIVNQNRDMEVHLPNYEPTDLASSSYFGTFDDDTDPGSNRYYKTNDNLFWAINIPERFDYPVEKQIIIGAHLHFAEWAQSDGTLFTDWYKDLAGYRNASVIY